MSHAATNWALYHAPTDSPAATLVLHALADRANPDGTDAHPYIDDIAEVARCSVSTAQRRMRELEDAGLIRRGDQHLVDHYPAGRKPVVWDLAMERTWDSVDDDHRGVNLTPHQPDVTDSDSSDVSSEPPSQGCQSDTPARSGCDPTPVSIDRRDRSAVTDSTVLVRSTSPHPPADAGGTPPDQPPPRPPVPDQRRPGTCAAHPRGHPNCRSCGTTPRQRAKAAARPPQPTWCRDCDRRTRLIEDDDGSMRRCPNCHPLATGSGAP